VGNLADCHEPLFDLIDALAANGRRTALVNYGARGWVSHHNTDIWAETAPVGNFGKGDLKWANWPMSAAWLSTHLFEHYAFGGDKAFLRERAWPVMKAAAEFGLDWLVDDGHGHRITPATPRFYAAARRALEIRGDDGTGWSLGWKINLWARFRDGDHAYVLVKNLLRPVHDDAHTTYGPGGGV
jgi:hypothetical protein